ncbi:MAG TPA: beta-ketoacyl-[acyl-carrier-protein] synthase II [Anaerolineae bacterium]|nr:beta-ketoacyl-[acyl-carrier-protein] synthase II [Anaerolineae bacterium]
MTEKIRVVVTGVGAVCSVGHDVETIWQHVVAGRPNVNLFTDFDASDLNTRFAALIEGYDLRARVGKQTLRRYGRYIAYPLAVTRQAMDDSGLDPSQVDPTRAGVILGSAIGGINAMLDGYDTLLTRGPRRISPFTVPAMLIDSAPGLVAVDYGFRGKNYGVVGACASGNYGVGEAYNAIARDEADVMITGGVEFGFHRFTVSAFDRTGALSRRNDAPNKASRPFDRDRDGFVLAEGAAILVLERLEHALARGATIYGEVLGYSATADAYHITAPREDALGAIESMQKALANAGLKPEDIDYINAHGTSTRLNDAAETQAIKAVFGEHAYQIPISSTKSVTGHLLGAAGAIEAIFSLLAIRDGVIPPTINYENPDPELDLDYTPNQARRQAIRYVMSNSFGFGGHNSTLILGGYPA